MSGRLERGACSVLNRDKERLSISEAPCLGRRQHRNE